MKLVSLLIQNNHKSPENYGLSFFKVAINSIQENMKNLALAIRMAQFAADKDFKEWIEEKEEIKNQLINV